MKPAAPITVIRAMSSAIVVASLLICGQSFCQAEDLDPDELFPSEIDSEPLMCIDSSSVTITQWQQPGATAEYQKDLATAEHLALAACNVGLNYFLRRLEREGFSEPSSHSDLPITDPSKATLGSVFKYETEVGSYRYTAYAKIVCNQCKITYLKVAKLFGCGEDPNTYSYYSLLTYAMNWYWKLHHIEDDVDGSPYDFTYCTSLKAHSQLNATVDVRHFCDLPCDGECTEKFYGSEVTYMTSYDYCQYGNVGSELPIEYNGANSVSVKDYW